MTVAHASGAHTWTRIMTSRSERWIAVSVVLAWAGILVLEAWPSSQPAKPMSLMHSSHAGHAVRYGRDAPWSATWLVVWILMVVAMMWPLTLRMASAIRRASYHHWWAICVSVSLLVFTVLWIAFGLVVASGARLASIPERGLWWQMGWLVTAVVVMAVLWPARRARLLWRCATFGPLAPSGWRGVVSSARAGVATWSRCARLCGPIMAAMAVGHSIVVMVFASASTWWEFGHARSWRDPIPVALLGVAATWVMISLVFVQGSA